MSTCTFFADCSPDQYDSGWAYLCDGQYPNAIVVAVVDDDTVILHISTTEEGLALAQGCPEFIGRTREDVLARFPGLAGSDVVETDNGPITVPRLGSGW